MGIARSTYYDQPETAVDDTALVETMGEISDSFEAYGYRRMQAALRQRGIVVNHKKVRRLMREHDLQPRIRRRFIATTDSDHALPIFPNVAKNVTPDGPNQLWVSDVTYVTIAAGFVAVSNRGIPLQLPQDGVVTDRHAEPLHEAFARTSTRAMAEQADNIPYVDIASGSAGASPSRACPGPADPEDCGWTSHADFGFAGHNRGKCRSLVRQRKQPTVIISERDTPHSDPSAGRPIRYRSHARP